MAAAIRHDTAWGPFLVVATVLGATALILMIAGVILNDVTLLVATTTAVVAVWLVTTAHHLVEAGPRPSPRASR